MLVRLFTRSKAPRARSAPRRRPIASRFPVAALVVMLFLAAACVVGDSAGRVEPTPAAAYGEPEVILAGTTLPPDLATPSSLRAEAAPLAQATAAPNSASTLEAQLAVMVESPASEASRSEGGSAAPAAPGPIAQQGRPLTPGILNAVYALQSSRLTLPPGESIPPVEPGAPPESSNAIPPEASLPAAQPDVPQGEATAILLPLPPAQIDAATPEPAAPGVTLPEVTPPEVTQPEVTPPEVTQPEVTAPQVTAPESHAPEAHAPEPAQEPQPPTPDGVARAARVPILMYHYLSAPPPGADIYRRDLSVSPNLFAAHLDRLAAEGYTTISLYDLVQFLATGAPLPEKPVILTFDDGYRDTYENAFPLLRERDMKATFFVVTDFIDEQRPEYLTWEMARAMRAAGMSIESHGRNHVSLLGKDDDYLVWQALGSLQTIEFELGVRPRFFSYPAGEYDQRTLDIVRSADFWAGVTTDQGVDHSLDDVFEWTRVRVRGTTSPDDLIHLLTAEW